VAVMAVARLPGERRQFLSGTDMLSDEMKIVNVSGIRVDVSGYVSAIVRFTKRFPRALDAVFLQIKQFRTPAAIIMQPSGLKVMVWPPKHLQRRTGFQINVDVNVSCSVSNVNMAVDALCFGH